MKRIFRLLAVCTLAGAPFLYTGCTDFSEDINAVNERIDKLVSGDVATIQTQISNLQSTVTSLESAKTEAAAAIERLQGQTASLESSVSALNSTVAGLETNLATLNTKLQAAESAIANLQGETGDLRTQLADAKTDILAKIATIEGQIALINSEIDAAKKNIDANKASIASLEGKVATIEQTVASIQSTVSALETNKADISWVEATFATLEQMKAANELIVGLRTDMTAVQERVALVEGRLSSVEERLQKIDAYHVQVSAQLANLESLVASNGAAIVGLGSLIDNAMTMITDNQKSINGLKEELAGLKKYCEEMDAVIEDMGLTLITVQNTANSALDLAETNKDEITAIHAALDKMYTAQEVDEKIDILKAILSNEIAINKAALEQYKKVTNGIIENLEASCNSNSERIEAVKSDLNALNSYWQEKVSKLNDALSSLNAELTALKKKVDSINEALNERINKLEGDYKDADVKLQNQINDILAALKPIDEQYSNAIEEMRSTYGVAIGSLSSRIQSIAYVPEYEEGAYAQTVTLDGKVVSERTEVTFKVTPSKYLDKVNFSTTTLLVTPQLKSATYDENELALDFEYDKEKGLVTVRIPANLDKKAVAICVKNGDETGSNLTSDFAKVSTRPEFEILDNYVLYNGETEYVSKTEEFGWDVWFTTEKVNPFAGYAPYIKYENKYYTIAEAKDLFLIEDIKTIEPVAQAPKAVYTPANDAKVKNALTVTGKTTDEIAIAKKEGAFAKAEDLIPCAKAEGQVVVTTAYKLGTIDIFALANKYSCKIINRQLSWTLKANEKTSFTRTEWTYDFAVKHSSAKTVAAYLDLPYVYDECEFSEATADYKEFQNVIKELAAAGKEKLYVSTNGSDEKLVQDGKKMTVTYKAGVLHQVADVTLDAGLYGFAEEGEITKVYKNKYTDEDNATDYNVTFTAEFAQAPLDQDVPLTAEGEFYDLTFTSIGASLKDLNAIPMTSLFNRVKSQEGMSKAFANDEAFNAAVFENTQIPSGYVYTIKNGKVIKGDPVSQAYTYLNVSAGDEFVHAEDLDSRKGQGLRVSTNADMDSADEKFALETKYKTWWGPTYTFTAHAQIVLPKYRLEYENTVWTDAEGNAEVYGSTKDGVWVIDDVKLNTYLRVVNKGDNKATDILKIEYEVVKPADAAKKGIANFPSTPEASDVNVDNNTYTERILEWGDYTATKLDVKATLVIINKNNPDKKITLDSKVLHFTTKDMVTMEPNPKNEVLIREGVAEIKGSFGNGIQIYGEDKTEGCIDLDNKKEQINFIKVDKDGVVTLWEPAATKYGLTLKFDKESLKVIVNEVDVTESWSSDNYTFDEATGVVNLKSNSALTNKKITFTVKATLEYNRDYSHLNAITKEVSVTFQGK